MAVYTAVPVVHPISKLDSQNLEKLKLELEALHRQGGSADKNVYIPEHFADIIKAERFIEESLQTLCEVHPGDSEEVLHGLVDERSSSSGWEAWTRNVQAGLSGK